MSDEDLPELDKLLEVSPTTKAVAHRVGRITMVAVCGLILLAWALTVWRQHHRMQDAAAEHEEAQTLALSYDAVRLAPKSFWDKSVLWRVGCRDYRSTTCYYEGDLNKPVRFPNGTELSIDGHKGMSFCRVLGKIKRVDGDGVYLEMLRSQGTRE